MSYSLFASYAREVSLRVAMQLALCNGITLTTAQLWRNKVVRELTITGFGE